MLAALPLSRQLVRTGGVLLALGCLSALAQQDDGELAGLDRCVQAALRQHDGLVIHWELEESPRAFEIEIAGKDDKTWKMRCDPIDTMLTDISRVTGSRTYKTLAERANVTDAQARESVRQYYPGRFEEMDYVLHWRGGARYKYELVTPDGRNAEVEVNAANGKIMRTKSEAKE